MATRVGLVTKATSTKSFTNNQSPPESALEWCGLYADNLDAVLCTWESASVLQRLLPIANLPSVIWMQESRWLDRALEIVPHDVGAFDLLISNDAERVAKGAAYMTLFGTWITREAIPEKTELVSMVASSKRYDGVEGYAMRRRVRDMLGRTWPHGFGKAFSRPIRDKFIALAPYNFSIAIESESYPWFHTEKLFDCFATKTVPLYWGCSDFSKLAEYGYDLAGIIAWRDLTDLVTILGEINESLYDHMHAAIEHNYKITREEYCTEIPLARLLREKLRL